MLPSASPYDTRFPKAFHVPFPVPSPPLVSQGLTLQHMPHLVCQHQRGSDGQQVGGAVALPVSQVSTAGTSSQSGGSMISTQIEASFIVHADAASAYRWGCSA